MRPGDRKLDRLGLQECDEALQPDRETYGRGRGPADLGDEVVYGVLRIHSSTGTSLIWPQQRIDIHNLHFNSNSPGKSESHLDTSSAQPGHPSAAD